MLVPLSNIDANVASASIVLSHVVGIDETWTKGDKDEFVDRLRDAAQRVVSKWRLLQGVAKKLEDGSWAVHVPDEREPSKPDHFGFIYEAVDKPYHIASGFSCRLPPLSSASSGFFPFPDTSVFRSADAPAILTEYERPQASFLHIKVTAFTDAIAIGISLAHGIFDGHGMGLVVQALDAELHHRPWPFDVPPLFSLKEGNPLVNTLDALIQDPDIAAGQVGLLSQGRGWISSMTTKLGAVAALAASFSPWRKNEERFGFLSRTAVEKLAAEAKAEVQGLTEREEYISTSDVLTAVLLKSAHWYESSSTPIKLAAVYNARSLLSSYEPSSSSAPQPFPAYPHNSIFPYELVNPEPVTLARLNAMSVGELALLLRRSLDSHRTLPALKSTWSYMPRLGYLPWLLEWLLVFLELPSFLQPFQALLTPVLPPIRHALSNQIGLKLASLSFPGRSDKDTDDLPLLAFHLSGASQLALTNCFALQDVKAGVVFSASLSPERWKGVEEAIEALKVGQQE
ncbi:hypothetical protein JCM8097_008150 [Rhodosporidiobolus ruineniae]